MVKKYEKEFLISELQRFYRENGRNPLLKDMTNGNGYPHGSAFKDNFGSWNKALEAARLDVLHYRDHWQDGTEVCDNCGEKTTNDWRYKNNIRLCARCYASHGYRFGNLSPTCSTGKAFKDQITVKQTREIKYDCNIIYDFNFGYDLFEKNELGRINVKSSKLYTRSDNNNRVWVFSLRNKQTPDNYIMLGYNKDRTEILRVWIIDALDDCVDNKTSFTIGNTHKTLNRYKYCEVDAKPYSDIYQQIDWNKCKILRSNQDE